MLSQHQIYFSGAQSGAILPPKGHWAVSGANLVVTNGDGYVCYGHPVGTVQGWYWTSYKGQEAPQTWNYSAKTSVELWMRNPSISMPPSPTPQRTSCELQRGKRAHCPLRPHSRVCKHVLTCSVGFLWQVRPPWLAAHNCSSYHLWSRRSLRQDRKMLNESSFTHWFIILFA